MDTIVSKDFTCDLREKPVCLAPRVFLHTDLRFRQQDAQRQDRSGEEHAHDEAPDAAMKPTTAARVARRAVGFRPTATSGAEADSTPSG